MFNSSLRAFKDHFGEENAGAGEGAEEGRGRSSSRMGAGKRIGIIRRNHQGKVHFNERVKQQHAE